MRARGTTRSVSYILALFLFVTACGDRSSESPASGPKTLSKSGAPRISIIQAPAAVRDRVRIDSGRRAHGSRSGDGPRRSRPRS